jgi:hypothetical protein
MIPNENQKLATTDNRNERLWLDTLRRLVDNDMRKPKAAKSVAARERAGAANNGNRANDLKLETPTKLVVLSSMLSVQDAILDTHSLELLIQRSLRAAKTPDMISQGGRTRNRLTQLTVLGNEAKSIDTSLDTLTRHTVDCSIRRTRNHSLTTPPMSKDESSETNSCTLARTRRSLDKGDTLAQNSIAHNSQL